MKQRTTYKKKSNRQVIDLVRSVLPPVETKYFDQVIALQPVANGNLYNISDITRGTDVTQRIGNQALLKHIHLKTTALINPAVDNAQIRVILMMDKQGTNAPIVTDILEAALVNTSYTSICPYYWEYKLRFKILHDEVISLTKYKSVTNRDINVKLNHTANYIGTSTTFTNQIYILVIGTELNVLALSTFNWHSRLTFTDS